MVLVTLWVQEEDRESNEKVICRLRQIFFMFLQDHGRTLHGCVRDSEQSCSTVTRNSLFSVEK